MIVRMVILCSVWQEIEFVCDLQLQCFGFAVSLVIMPLFISEGNNHSNLTQYFGEIMIAGLLAIGGYIGYTIFIVKEKKSKKENSA